MTEVEYVEKLVRRLEYRIDKVENVLTALLAWWSVPDGGPTIAEIKTLLNKILEDDRLP